MTDNATPPISIRWDDPDGSWWIITSDPDRGRYDATKFTLVDGDERIVDDIGFGDRHITTLEELTAEMHRALPPEVLEELAAVTLAQPEPDASINEPGAGSAPLRPHSPLDERPMGTRYRIDLDDNSWWELGWDKPLGTFYATRLTDDDDEPGQKVLDDYGNGLSEIATIDQLGDVIGQPVPPGIAHELAADAAAHTLTTKPRFLRPELLGEPTPDRFALWEAHLQDWEARLEAWAASLAAQSRVEPVWTLPAGPVVDALHSLQRDMAAEDNLAVFATGLGLPPPLVEALQTEQPGPLKVDEISQVCEALHCSPYDLWGPELAQRILHAYGPERWPSHIEPLAQGRELASPDVDFLDRRRVQVDHDAHITSANPPVAPAAPADEDPRDPPPKVTAVCYVRVGLLAEEPDGTIRAVDPAAPGSADVEAYHLAFRQVTLPRDVRLYPPTGIGEPAPAGHDADPTLANTADSFRNLPWLPKVDLVRFVDEHGYQEWLGWNPDAETWQAWDDPRTSYPGPPHDVLDPAGLTEPEITAATETIEMDDRVDSNTQQWHDYAPEFADLLPDTDDTLPLPDLDF